MCLCNKSNNHSATANHLSFSILKYSAFTSSFCCCFTGYSEVFARDPQNNRTTCLYVVWLDASLDKHISYASARCVHIVVVVVRNHVNTTTYCSDALPVLLFPANKKKCAHSVAYIIK